MSGINHVSGKDFKVLIGGLLILFETISLTISDNRKAVQNAGVPSGWVDGDVSASGELEIDSREFLKLQEVAAAYGSWRAIPPLDINFLATNVSTTQYYEAFGCLLTLSDLLNADAKGGEKTKHKIKYEVTSPDFININGIPYLRPEETIGL